MRGYRSDEHTSLFDLEQARISPFSLSGDANLGDIEAVVADVGEELLRHHAACNPAEVAPLAAAANPESQAVAAAQVSIECSVANADVYIDGKFVGNAPLPSYRLPAGTHVIEVRAGGYQPWKRELVVGDNAATRVMAQLERTPSQ